jgi:hypothetical protein
MLGGDEVWEEVCGGDGGDEPVLLRAAPGRAPDADLVVLVRADHFVAHHEQALHGAVAASELGPLSHLRVPPRSDLAVARARVQETPAQRQRGHAQITLAVQNRQTLVRLRAPVTPPRRFTAATRASLRIYAILPRKVQQPHLHKTSKLHKTSPQALKWRCGHSSENALPSSRQKRAWEKNGEGTRFEAFKSEGSAPSGRAEYSANVTIFMSAQHAR